MIHTVRTILLQLYAFKAPLLGTLFAVAGHGFYMTFVSFHFAEKGDGVIGMVQAAFFLGLLIGSWKVEWIIRVIGHIQTLATCGSLLTAMTLIQSMTDFLPVWIVTRMVAGLTMAALYVVIECWLLDHATPKQRGTILSFYMISLNAGYIVGQQLLKGIEIDSNAPFILAGLLTSISVIPVALSTRRITAPEVDHGVRFSHLLKKSPFGTMSCLIVGISISSFYSFMALVASSKGFSGENSIIILILGALVMQWPIGALSDFFDRRKTLFALHLSYVIVCLIFLFSWSAGAWTFYLLTFILGGVIFSSYPVSLTQVTDHLRTGQMAAAISTLLVVYGCGTVCGPLVTSFLMNLWGEKGLILTVFGAGCVALGLGTFSLIYSKPIPEDKQKDFVPLPRTTTLVSELDPRQEGTS